MTSTTALTIDDLDTRNARELRDEARTFGDEAMHALCERAIADPGDEAAWDAILDAINAARAMED